MFLINLSSVRFFIKYSFGKFAKTDNIIKMLQSVPGKVLFRYQKSGNGGYSCKFNSENVFEVNSFAWILPFADEIIQKIQYLQIDASFSAFPNKLYNLDENFYKGHVILADMGKAIKSFCNIYNMPRFIYHRHLIEKFGANSPLGFMVTRLLNAQDETEYLQISEEIKTELKIYIKIKEEISEIDNVTLKKIEKLKIMLSGLKGKFDSNYFIYKWARWVRADYNVARCTNHTEGAHGNINTSIEHRGAANFSTGLSSTINYVLNVLQNRQNNHGTSFGRYHHKQREKFYHQKVLI